jgi:hypothetical protein
LNSRYDQSPSRWVINFFDRPLDRASAKEGYSGKVASDYPDCIKIIEERVKPERQRRKPDGTFVLRKPLPQRWWQYADKRPALYAAIAGLERVLVKTQVSPTWAFEFVPNGIVFDQKLVVLCDNPLGLLQSSIHWAWALEFGSTLGKTTYNYTPTDCFETFPFPESVDSLTGNGIRYQEFRHEIMLTRQEGLTKTYNRFHDQGEMSEDIAQLRALHVEMDKAVAAAYGWSDLDLGHGFHDTKQGVRYTISESARRVVLDRLLTLNHQRYEEELRTGLHEKKAKGKSSGQRGRKKLAQAQIDTGSSQSGLF